MRISLPYSRNKRYLTGIDWMISALDHLTRKSTGAGTASQIVLQLDSAISENDLKTSLKQFAHKVPVISGRQVRDLNLAPYWRIQAEMPCRVPKVSIHHPTSSRACLAEAVNTSLLDRNEYIAFHILHQKDSDEHFLAMTFDHRLLDARGAETLLDTIQRYPDGMEDCDKLFSPPEPAHLDNWLDRFRAGQRVNRALRAMAKAPIEFLSLPDNMRNRPFRFATITFSEEETGIISNNACDHAGYFMLMPYVLATITQLLHEVLGGKDPDKLNYVVPVSIDMRNPDRIKEEMFFNHLSFLFFHLLPQDMADRKSLTQKIMRQMYDQTQSNLPRDLHDVNMLMRIAPLCVLTPIMRKLRLILGSFAFSCVGDSAYKSRTFMGAKILNLFHMPRVPTPPGFGFFLNKFNGKLNMVLSYVDGMLTDAQVDEVMQKARQRLIDG